MKLVTAEEMRRLERAANDADLTYAIMMENAGHAVALAIAERTRLAHVAVLIGPGNNGGDGLVVARYLYQWGYKVDIYIWKRTQQDDPNLARAQELGILFTWAEQDRGFQKLSDLVRSCDVLVDALLGTGVTGPLHGNLCDLLRSVRRGLEVRAASIVETLPPRILFGATSQARIANRTPLVVAVDLPSGLNSDTGEIDELALTADLTVTFAYPKRGQFLFPGAAYVGELQVADIGLSPALAEGLPTEVGTPQEIASYLPKRPPDAHKGTFGKALIVAGSTNYVGAPYLAAEAAYRSGAGLVTLAVAERIYSIVATKLTEATLLVLPDDLGVLIPSAVRVLAKAIQGYDALLLGPGLGREPATRDFIGALLMGNSPEGRRPVGFGVSCRGPEQPLKLPPTVIDADGLNLLATFPCWWEHLPQDTVLTPHMGEMARLVGCEIQDIAADRFGKAHEAAMKWRCTVVLKGAHTIVASAAGNLTAIPFANPALATAGTGDVMAGTIVGLMAQGLPGQSASICGAYLHGLAGEIWRERWGQVGMLASDLLPLLPQAVQRLRPDPQ